MPVQKRRITPFRGVKMGERSGAIAWLLLVRFETALTTTIRLRELFEGQNEGS
jgi:hypothetical protein